MTTRQASPANVSPEQMATAGLQAFFAISEQWQLSARDERTLLGNPPESTFYKWKSERAARSLSHDTLERISYILGIYKALHILLPPSAANEWVHKSNTAPLFGGKTALSRLTAGNVADLIDVRRYLDAQRGA
ncbi:MAG: DUF2384 domain-containing protein [Gammaproteobacteria bacterium]|nr:DUF2384 domain-containing protein [Gammaproteobacteria bacterium]